MGVVQMYIQGGIEVSCWRTSADSTQGYGSIILREPAISRLTVGVPSVSHHDQGYTKSGQHGPQRCIVFKTPWGQNTYMRVQPIPDIEKGQLLRCDVRVVPTWVLMNTVLCHSHSANVSCRTQKPQRTQTPHDSFCAMIHP